MQGTVMKDRTVSAMGQIKGVKPVHTPTDKYNKAFCS